MFFARMLIAAVFACNFVVANTLWGDNITAVSSSSWKENTPEKAFDNNPATGWQTSQTSGGWLECRFETPRQMSRITTTVNKAHIVDMRIEISPDDTSGYIPVAAQKGIKDGVWNVTFSPRMVKRVRTTIDRCAHKWMPEKVGVWPMIYEQKFINDQAPYKSVVQVNSGSKVIPYAPIPLLTESPVQLDGRMTDPAWRQGTLLSNFNWDGQLVANQSEVRIFATGKSLFIGAQLFEKDMKKLKAQKKASHSNAIFSDDVIELFFASAEQPDAYVQIVVNPNGAFHVLPQSDIKLDLTGIKVMATRGDTFWQVEIELPWQSIGLTAPAAGRTFRMNICRDEKPYQERSSWSALSGGFHKPNLFGEVKISSDPVVNGMGISALRATQGGIYTADFYGRSDMKGEFSAETSHQAMELISGQATPLQFSVAGYPAVGALRITREGNELYRTAQFTLSEPLSVNLCRSIQTLLADCREGAFAGSDSALERQQEFSTQFQQAQQQPSSASESKLIALKKAICDWRLKIAAINAGNAATGGLACGVSAMTKVLPTESWEGTLAARIDLWSPRNAYENAQIAVFASSAELNDVGIEVRPLRSADGTAFNGKIALYNVGLVKSQTRPTLIPYMLTGGLYPDPLLPHQSFAIPAGENRSVWMEIFVPEDAVPGDYQGEIVVKWNGAARQNVPFHLKVCKAVLPITHSLATPFSIDKVKLGQQYGLKPNSKELADMVEKYRRFCVQHRMDWFFYPPGRSYDFQETDYPRCIYRDGKFVWDFKDFDIRMDRYIAEGMNSFSLGFSWSHWLPVYDTAGNLLPQFSGKAVCELKEQEAKPYVDAFAEYMKHLKEKGWFERTYYYVADEPQPKHYSAIRRQAEVFLNVVPELRSMITAGAPMPLRKDFNIWCPNLAFYDPEIMDQQAREGKEIWWYVCIGPYHPNYYVDFETIDCRIHFWLTYRYGLKGVLYWRVNSWPGKADWDVFKTAKNFGDGYIFYPGPDGPLPSIRSMALRAGIEDFELMKLLAKKDPKSKILDLNDICPSVSNYVHNPETLENKRRLMLQALEQERP